ncbi:MAG: hypothetical protein U9P79_10420 [Candidatus Cloacimonadota bacterium]|nr:hypothetical protein [Candidatus Cloacimonadota bacterium]
MKWKKWSKFANNESNWQNHQERGLLKAEYLRDYVLRIWFEEDLDISIYELDFYPLLLGEYPGEVLLPLRDKKRFQKVSGDYTLIWLNSETGDYDEKAIDIAPECIRYFCENYGKEIKIPQKKAA